MTTHLTSPDGPSASEFFATAREREAIRLNRAARLERSCWTKDPVFRQYRFCNVHRENDRTTEWFRHYVRGPLSHMPGEALVATVGFRWFNRIEVGQRIHDMLIEGRWDSDYVRARLSSVQPLVTGAYMVKTPAAMSKLEGIIWCMEEFLRLDMPRRLISGMPDHRETLEGFHRELMSAPYLGAFMAYEIVTDLRHTYLLRNAPDIMTWANPGPGAARGLGWVLHGDPDFFDRHKAEHVQRMNSHMRDLLAMSVSEWPATWDRWEMREVEHWLCEYDKWCRATYRGERLKRRFD